MTKKANKKAPSSQVRPPIPTAFLERMQTLLNADEFAAFHSNLDAPPTAGLRFNTLKVSPSELAPYTPFPLQAPISWCQEGYWLPPLETAIQTKGQIFPAPGAHPFHAAGLYYLQDPAAMAATVALDPQPGERILDLAAAPGGKSTHIAARLQGQGLLFANEIHPQRVWDLAENLERWGVHNVIVANETPERLAEQLPGFFDRILLDAPCSGEGMFRKSASARSAWTPALVQGCALRQQSIIATAARLLRPGGRLVYSTCTFAPEENEQIVERFLSQQPEFHLGNLPTGLQGAAIGAGMARLYPHHGYGEGHFIAVLQHSGKAQVTPSNSNPNRNSRQNKPRAGSKTPTEWQAFLDDTGIQPIEPASLLVNGAYLYALEPEIQVQVKGLKLIHPGWWLGILKKGRFKPSHALALGLSAAEDALQTLRLLPDEPRLKAYLSGERIPASILAGWTLVTVQGGDKAYPIGWARADSNGILKNFYPKGLRRN